MFKNLMTAIFSTVIVLLIFAGKASAQDAEDFQKFYDQMDAVVSNKDEKNFEKNFASFFAPDFAALTTAPDGKELKTERAVLLDLTALIIKSAKEVRTYKTTVTDVKKKGKEYVVTIEQLQDMTLVLDGKEKNVKGSAKYLNNWAETEDGKWHIVESELLDMKMDSDK